MCICGLCVCVCVHYLYPKLADLFLLALQLSLCILELVIGLLPRRITCLCILLILTDRQMLNSTVLRKYAGSDSPTQNLRPSVLFNFDVLRADWTQYFVNKNLTVMHKENTLKEHVVWLLIDFKVLFSLYMR